MPKVVVPSADTLVQVAEPWFVASFELGQTPSRVMSNFNPGKCKSCGADVIFIELEGKRLILNKRRERVYRKERQELGGMFRLMVDNGSEPMLLHISHFTTCPQASKHSKGKA